MSYGTDYLDIPTLKPERVGRVKSMTKTATTNQEAPKASRKYSKTRGEHLKDIVIAMLIVGVVAFVAGVHYADSKNAQMASAVKSAQTATAVAPTAKK